MIGKKVRVFWPVDSSWYTGIVQKYNAETGEHLLKYDDDDTEWVKIGESGAGAGQTTSGAHGRSMSPARSNSGERISPIPAGHPSGESPSNPMAPYGAEGISQGWQGARQQYPPYAASGAPGQLPPQGMAYPAPGMPGYGYPPGYPHGAYQGVPYGYPPPMMGVAPNGPVPSAGKGTKAKPDASDGAQSPTPSEMSSRKKSGPRVWTKEEDQLLLNLVQGMRMPMKWSVVAQSMPDRTGKQCRERYVNHLNPRLKTSDWSPVEDATVFHLYSNIGSHWAKMAKMIPGRTDNGKCSRVL